jgi:lipopolysaccharide/colanic/teichoic acid biosynthesis glycosyltransferase
LLVLLVRSTSRGPGLYQQVRVGRHGKIFVMYKIRSMVQDAEVGTGPVWTQDSNDPRITRLGMFLRKSHLDELPQLLNVARGEMALFGPRPERPELVHVLADNIPGYLNRLAVLPGITGLAQINLPPDSDLESVRQKLELDVEYIEMANLWLEVRMFLWTGLRLVAIPASIATRMCNLGRNVKPVSSRLDRPVAIQDVLDMTGAGPFIAMERASIESAR